MLCVPHTNLRGHVGICSKTLIFCLHSPKPKLACARCIFVSLKKATLFAKRCLKCMSLFRWRLLTMTLTITDQGNPALNLTPFSPWTLCDKAG